MEIRVCDKSGLSSSDANYRLISLTCVANNGTRYFLHSISLLKRTRYANKTAAWFLWRKSTTTSLLVSLNDWSLVVKLKRYVDVAFKDFAKAFDSVSHPKLFAKLQSYGITGILHKWIISFF